jgi:hypothetical protein
MGSVSFHGKWSKKTSAPGCRMHGQAGWLGILDNYNCPPAMPPSKFFPL